MSDAKIQSFSDLRAWQKGHEFVLATLKECEDMPRYDTVRGRLERAVLSITANIAEGFGCQSTKDKKHFYIIARGSAYEVQNHLIVARDTNRINQDSFKLLADLSLDSTRLLHGLIRSLEKDKSANSYLLVAS